MHSEGFHLGEYQERKRKNNGEVAKAEFDFNPNQNWFGWSYCHLMHHLNKIRRSLNIECYKFDEIEYCNYCGDPLLDEDDVYQGLCNECGDNEKMEDLNEI